MSDCICPIVTIECEKGQITERELAAVFSVGELAAYLYARSFPENEWRQRVEEAFKTNENL